MANNVATMPTVTEAEMLPVSFVGMPRSRDY
jgi:hypothetical protein